MARPEWWNLYDHDHIDLPDVPPLESLDPHTVRIRRGIEADTIGYTEDQCRNARHAYYANTSYFDSWLGDRGAWFKMSCYERSARVPQINSG